MAMSEPIDPGGVLVHTLDAYAPERAGSPLARAGGELGARARRPTLYTENPLLRGGS